MPRDIDSTLLAALSAPFCSPVSLFQFQFRSQVCRAWTGVGTLAWGGQSFLGVGSLGAMGDVTEVTEISARGTNVVLSGIDPVYLGEALNDIQPGAPAYRWLGAVQPGTRTLIGTPYLQFSGQVDKPTLYTGPDKMLITLALESRMINHSRASNRKLTANDQHANGYPDDISMNWVEIINNIALLWG